MSDTRTSPSDSDLAAALTSLRGENPGLGIPKLHTLLLSKHPGWLVSEKRTRKVLQSLGLTNAAKNTSVDSGEGLKSPSSKLLDGLDPLKYTQKGPAIRVEYFDQKKGKGLVAATEISEGTVIWREDPFVLAPEWEIYDLTTNSVACTFCSTPFSDPSSPLIVKCPHSSSSVYCPARFCNRLCSTRSAKVSHTLLCPARNPKAKELFQFTRVNHWMALHALVQCTARLLLSAAASSPKQPEPSLDEEWTAFHSLASLSLQDREAWLGSHEHMHPTWKEAFRLYRQALWDPPTDADKKRLARLSKRTFQSAETEAVRRKFNEELFSYDVFLRNLGRMSLNLEGHGGLYILHSHLNHSCTPSVSVRHLHRSTNLSRVSLLANRDIAAGEELLISYVDPALPVSARQHKLREWSFSCECERCKEEGLSAGDGHGEVERPTDLERELKAGLGLF